MTSPSSARSEPAQIRVTLHALARARERHPDLRLLAERDLLKTICREVGAALRTDRVAKTAPRETVTDTYTRRQKAGRDRYAWTPSRSRVYLLRRVDNGHLVVTVLRTSLSQS
jgi:hypothetical protein